MEVHDLHVWEVTSGFPALSAHVTVRAGCDTQAHRRQLAELLRERFEIVTLDPPGGDAPRGPAHDRAARARNRPVIEPMKAVLADTPFSDPDWIFERKLDGIRCLATRDASGVGCCRGPGVT